MLAGAPGVSDLSQTSLELNIFGGHIFFFGAGGWTYLPASRVGSLSRNPLAIAIHKSMDNNSPQYQLMVSINMP